MKSKFLFLTALGLSLFSNAQNLVSNGSFESGMTGWLNLASDGGAATFSLNTTDKYDGTQAFQVNVTTLGTNPWSIQSIYNTGWTGTVGKTYVMDFYAKATTAGTSLSVIEQINSTYLAQSYSLTTDWKKYEWIFTYTETGLQLKFQFPQTGTILLDAISIVQQGGSDAQSITDTFSLAPATKFQTLDGFGGAIAFYNSWVIDHPAKEEMYQLLFDSLGLDWLRIQNSYRNETNFTTTDLEFVQKAKQYNPDAKVLMSSWSPPADLKDIGSTDSGTLAKENGQFVYGKFGKYWHDALVAYGNIGIYPDMISIQNEPDWLTTQWATCKFVPTETSDYPGYDKALDSVYAQIQGLPQLPKIIGAEPLGIGYNDFDNYNTPIKNKPYLYGYNYHLYHGGSPGQPDSYNSALADIASNFGDKPNFMTEFELFDQGWFKTAWLVNNVLVSANASAFFYWNVVWPGTGLINMESPYDQGSWKTTKGYSINPHFYAFQHFSKPLSGGFKRVAGINSNPVLKSSVFLDSTGTKLVAILINTGAKAVTTSIQLSGQAITGSTLYQSVQDSYYKNIGSLPVSGSLTLPDTSITTLVMDIRPLIAGLNDNSFAGNDRITCYPNPFVQSTQVKLTEPFVYSVYDVTGRLVEKGNAAGSVSLGEQYPSGIYTVKTEGVSMRKTIKIVKR